MSKDNLGAVALDVLKPLEQWSKRCHEASIMLVRSGRFPTSRVARGTCDGVGGQHSWVVLGNPYDREATIIDATLWSYYDNGEKPRVYVCKRELFHHRPFGTGSIWEWGRPPEAVSKPIELEPKKPWSKEARVFLAMLGPLDEEGWRVLAHAPVEGWPACEILEALACTKIGAFIPTDIIGMATTLPHDLYPRG